MPAYTAPLRDMKFVLYELLQVESHLAQLPAFSEVRADIIDPYLEIASQFCENELLPLNRSGDEQGCSFDAATHAVTTPTGFREAYEKFRELGFTGLDCDPAFGGQGMPKVLALPIMEMQTATNVAWSMYPGLSHGAYSALHTHGSETLKATYLPKLVSGEWAGTMCLTESHCGTDLSLIKTRAEPVDANSYTITGTKIFISAGEHDLTDNILHLVLARTPNAPPGIKGISLFLVPKFLPNAENNVGTRNPVYCGALEHKMGIKGNATAVINLEGATGYLIGDLHRGMNCMFTMMNAARLGCGLQGLGIGEAAYQAALIYAKERLQMRALGQVRNPQQPADPIIVHPDVRRMLLTGKAYTEAGRAFALWLALQLDIEANSTDSTARQDAADLVALLTPVAKAFMTDNGYLTANLSLQVFGGHGYICESGMEQFVRDCRISQIYEGTNGIQALDLLGRKVLLDQGQKLRKFTRIIHKFCESTANMPAMTEFTTVLSALNKEIGEITMKIGMRALEDPQEAGAAAVDYLRLMGHLTYAYFWARAAQIAFAASADNDFYQAKIATARFYYHYLLPETAYLTRCMDAGAKPLLALDAAHFQF